MADETARDGKTAADENFPVGSVLIARRLRGHVARFYAFARTADDIADSPDLEPEAKIAGLDALEAGLVRSAPGPAVAARLADSLDATGVPARHALDLLRAFRQDATKRRYGDWDELLAYCTLSANPVGAYLLDLHGEDEAARPASDALCTVLQVLNHLQDLKSDLLALDRCYLPQDWLTAEGAKTADLLSERENPAIRRVIDRALAACAPLIAAAGDLPPALRSRRLAAEARVIGRLARRLAARLAVQDPIAGRVALSKLDFAAATLAGIATLLAPIRRTAGRARRRTA